MASKSLSLLIKSGLAAMAIGIVAYNVGILDPYLPAGSTDKQAEADAAGAGTSGAGEVQSADKETASGSEETKQATVDQSGADASDTAETAGEESSAEVAVASDVVAPRFDIVRVETDGNVVIAGNAPAGSTVEVITGARTLGQAEAGVSGDFAVVLSDPLEPGDYTIVLRSTSPDETVAMSAETAIVSVPESESGEVLAIVDEPGKPSKLITVPESEEPAEAEETNVAAADTEASEEGTVASNDGTATSEQTDSGEKTESEQAEATDTAAQTVEVAGATETDATEVEGQQAEAATGSQAALTDTDNSESKEAETAEAVAAAEKETEVAALTSEEAETSETAPTKAEPAADLNIAVEAVEIEGDQVFVAGTATPGKIVRIYANRDLIGETQSSEIGRFLVESNRGLAVGEYIIRADMLEVGSAEVVARAAVPFERDAGQSVAAVAPSVTDDSQKAAEAKTEETATAETEAAVDTESQEPAAEADKTVAAAADTGTEETQSGTETASETRVATNEAAEETAESEASSELAEDNTASSNEQVASAASEDIGSNDDGAEDAGTGNGSQSTVATSEDSEGQGGDETVAVASNESAASTDEAQTEATTEVAAAEPGDIEYPAFGQDVALTAPKLKKTSGSVIIRRGDTLWRISRRVYGRGIRYTTIYTANRDQIKNPHRIWPGQIFDVPGESEDGEAADLGAIADRTPTPEDIEGTQ